MSTYPQVTDFPVVNNRGVVRSGRATFTLKHPDTKILDPPLTIGIGAIFELLDHQAAIMKLAPTASELLPEPFTWRSFVKFWNYHAAEDGPRFTTWDDKTQLYFHPLRIVTPADFGITRRIPKIDSALAKPPNVDAKASQLQPTPSPMYRPTPAATTTTNTSTAALAGDQATLSDLLPSELKDKLVTTGIRSWVRQEEQKAEFFKRREQERKAKDAVKRNEKKSKKKSFWKGKAAARHSSNPSNEDVDMTGPIDDNHPSSSKTSGA